MRDVQDVASSGSAGVVSNDSGNNCHFLAGALQQGAIKLDIPSQDLCSDGGDPKGQKIVNKINRSIPGKVPA